MSSMLTRIRDVAHYGLVLQTLLDLLRRIGLEITPYYLVEESLDWLPPEAPQVEIPGFSLRPLQLDDAAAVETMPEGGLTAAQACTRLEERVYGLGGWVEGELVAFVWAHLEELDFEPCRRPLARDEAYLFGARTSRRFRGQNLSPALRRELYWLLGQQGRTRLLSISYTFNRPALRFKQKLGARCTHLYATTSLAGRWRRNWLLWRRSAD